MDQAAEWRRLKDLYSQMNEGELEIVANEAYDLTDLARPLLRDEIASRGLKIPLRTARSAKLPANPSKLDLVLAGTLWDLDRARTVHQLLEDAGIPSFWGPDNVENLDALKFSPEEGLDLMVRADDLARVQAGLAQIMPHEAEEKEYSVVCPKCHSAEIVFNELDEKTSTFNWSCDTCGHVWSDDGVESHA